MRTEAVDRAVTTQILPNPRWRYLKRGILFEVQIYLLFYGVLVSLSRSKAKNAVRNFAAAVQQA